jgi:ABC-type antimicrobial peptide transport system permease subunit
MVLKEGMTLVVSGVVIGLLFCILASTAVTTALGVPSFNRVLVVLVSAGLAVVAALGAYIPARRASLVNPHSVLRPE